MSSNQLSVAVDELALGSSPKTDMGIASSTPSLTKSKFNAHTVGKTTTSFLILICSFTSFHSSSLFPGFLLSQQAECSLSPFHLRLRCDVVEHRESNELHDLDRLCIYSRYWSVVRIACNSLFIFPDNLNRPRTRYCYCYAFHNATAFKAVIY